MCIFCKSLFFPWKIHQILLKYFIKGTLFTTWETSAKNPKVIPETLVFPRFPSRESLKEEYGILDEIADSLFSLPIVFFFSQ